MGKRIHGYHAHVYFDESSRPRAEQFRRALLDQFGGGIRIHHLIDAPIGPHPKPMFEVDLRPEDFGTAVPWMMIHHDSLSILIHPITGDDLADHRDHPIWIGPQLKLDLSVL